MRAICESGSQVYGALRRGVFEGSIHTAGDDFYVERASNYFNGSAPFHSVLYSARDVQFPPPEGTGGSQRRRQWCGLYGHRERWMNRVLDSFGKRKVGEADTKHRYIGRRLHGTLPEAEEEEDTTDVDQSDSSPERGAVNETKRRSLDISRRVCNLQVNIDHTLFQKFYDHDEDPTLTRERLADLIVAHVRRANIIYGATNFGGIEDISFVVQSIKMNDTSHCLGLSRISNPFCVSGMDSAHMLHVASLANHDDFCLSYTWTYRDFSDGVLGLAWIAKREAGSGGICEKYRMSVELAPDTNKYKEFQMSLNTGIVTFQNYHNFVPQYISTITFSHEIGHNFGSPIMSHIKARLPHAASANEHWYVEHCAARLYGDNDRD
ncbi:disintegrin and metalloproteinase domain-containing protein 10-like [Ixodes scapularis]|uniref:disintegrin and metalloproteinase domain-containing protein 10-like n=1 Tax=Ixodes scapularis TaxID=6945 RepID=UPI001C38852E|nr:disintegrin and metalloproteinase domain-containing protein 10-like [Ixodes scapularis]